ncbi:MAG: hypothetical protein NC089_11380, partial [Bacteroides sp.]|nr:hypothetical protein [Bacteroides sp.]MCM1550198.1 hypothetical protein [Clostridium sp.]
LEFSGLSYCFVVMVRLLFHGTYRTDEPYNSTRLFRSQGEKQKKVYSSDLFVLYIQLSTTYPHEMHTNTHIHILS